MYKLVLICVSFLFLASAPAQAAGQSPDTWLVTQLSGDARIAHPGLQPASVHVNSQLAPGDTLLTGPTGRATLIRGGDYIVVAPRSELKLPTAPQPAGFTRVIQTLGTMLFKVQHTGIPHFAVDTPMLAAVVKGTTFTVVVDQHRSAIQVIQGVVQVTAVKGGMSRMVEGGRTVFVDHSTPQVLLDADQPHPATAAPSSTSISISATDEAPLATIATMTGGLVRADLSSPQATGVAPASTVGSPVLQLASSAEAATPAMPSSTTSTPATGAVGAIPAATVVVGTPAAAPATTQVISTPPTATPIASVPVVTTPVVTTPTAAPPVVTTPVVTTPSVTVPAVTTPIVAIPPVTAPPVTIASVTVPLLTSGPSPNSGPGSTNSGSGSSSSGPGSGTTAPTLTVPTVTTPTLTVPSVTAPVIAVTTPTLTVPSVTTPTVTVPLPPLPHL